MSFVITRTPLRISFFGGGTDYPDWIGRHGGKVLSTTFDKYSYVSCRFLPADFGHRHRVVHSGVEHVARTEDIPHPAIRAVLMEAPPGEGLDLQCDADLPAGCGLGASSAFVVGLLNALHGLRRRAVTRRWLAEEAMRIEQRVLRETVGCQDQVATAMGGLNLIRFHRAGGFAVEPVVVDGNRRRELNRHLMLFFTGLTRISSVVAGSCLGQMLGRADDLGRLGAMVDDGVGIIADGRDIRRFGELLHEAWTLKRRLADRVTTPAIDAIYDTARAAGAIGGKLLGAGGGGFMLIFAEPSRQEAIRRALGHLVHVPFLFENSGSRIIYAN